MTVLKKTIITESILIETTELEHGNYHIFITAKTNRKKIRLLIDTGASKTVFDKNSYEKLFGSNIKKQGYAESIGLGTDIVKTDIAVLPYLKFNKLKIKNVEVAVLNLTHINNAYKLLGLKSIDGVLGCDLLIMLKADISFKTKCIKLRH